jgi:hypothetical protein
MTFSAYLSLYGIVMQLLNLWSPKFVVEGASVIWQMYRSHLTNIDSPLLLTITKAVPSIRSRMPFIVSSVAGTKSREGV